MKILKSITNKRLIIILSIVFVLGIGTLGWLSKHKVSLYESAPPFDIYITNIQDRGFNIVWSTSEANIGKVRIYSQEKDEVKFISEFKDEADQPMLAHQVTIDKLEQNSTYFIGIISNGTEYHNAPDTQNALKISTVNTIENPNNPAPFYGEVLTSDSGIDPNTIVFAYLETETGIRSTLLSSRVNSEGKWIIDPANARIESNTVKGLDNSFRVKKIIANSPVSGSTEFTPSNLNLRPVETIYLGKDRVVSQFLLNNNVFDEIIPANNVLGETIIARNVEDATNPSAPTTNNTSQCNCSTNRSACSPDECTSSTSTPTTKSCPDGTIQIGNFCKRIEPETSSQTPTQAPTSDPSSSNNETSQENDLKPPVNNQEANSTTDSTTVSNPTIKCLESNNCNSSTRTNQDNYDECVAQAKSTGSTNLAWYDDPSNNDAGSFDSSKCQIIVKNSSGNETGRYFLGGNDPRYPTAQTAGNPTENQRAAGNQICEPGTVHPTNSCLYCQDGTGYLKKDTEECQNDGSNPTMFYDTISANNQIICNEIFNNFSNLFGGLCSNKEAFDAAMTSIAAVENSLHNSQVLEVNNCAVQSINNSVSNCNNYNNHLTNENNGSQSLGIFQVNTYTANEVVRLLDSVGDVLPDECKSNYATNPFCNQVFGSYILAAKIQETPEIKNNSCLTDSSKTNSPDCLEAISIAAKKYNGNAPDSVYKDPFKNLYTQLISTDLHETDARTVSNGNPNTGEDPNSFQTTTVLGASTSSLYINTPISVDWNGLKAKKGFSMPSVSVDSYGDKKVDAKALQSLMQACLQAQSKTGLRSCILDSVKKLTGNTNKTTRVAVNLNAQPIATQTKEETKSTVTDDLGSLLVDSASGTKLNVNIPDCKTNTEVVLFKREIADVPCQMDTTVSEGVENGRSLIQTAHAQSGSLGQLISKFLNQQDAERNALTDLKYSAISLYNDVNKNNKKDANEEYLDIAGIPVEITNKGTVSVLKLNKGWNVVSFPVYNENLLKASTFMKELARQGGYATTIAYYDPASSNWISYKIRGNQVYSGADFDLSPARGYFIYSVSDFNFIYSGNRQVEPVKVNLSAGWNLIGIHPGEQSNKLIWKHPEFNLKSDLSAYLFLSTLNRESLLISEFSTLDSGRFYTITPKADGENDLSYFGNDFAISDEGGYFVNATKDFQLIP